MKQRKAQATLMGLLMVFIMIIVLAILTEPIDDVLEEITNNSAKYGTTLVTIVDLVPIMLWLGLILTIFIYITPRRE